MTVDTQTGRSRHPGVAVFGRERRASTVEIQSLHSKRGWGTCPEDVTARRDGHLSTLSRSAGASGREALGVGSPPSNTCAVLRPT